MIKSGSKDTDTLEEYTRNIMASLRTDSLVFLKVLFSLSWLIGPLKSTEFIVKLKMINIQPKRANISCITSVAVSLLTFENKRTCWKCHCA